MPGFYSDRRAILRGLVAFLLLFGPLHQTSADDTTWQAVETAEIAAGDLKVLLRDNAQSPSVLSGVDSLFNVRDARDFDAFDPDTRGASAGLNFEHIICGHKSEHNAFAPRHHKYVLERSSGAPGARLVRAEEDDPWRTASTFSYTLAAPNAIDLDFRCRFGDPQLFGQRGYAVLFFANYMNDMEQVAINFLGTEKPGDAEHWIAADAPSGHADYNGGGSYRAASSPPLEYDADHNFKLNLWSYDQPRFTRPFYYGRAARGMVVLLMFDGAYNQQDEIRFSLFKFKVPKFPRPALDWQYVIHKVEAGREYGFRGRLVWKKFVSPEDCLAEYERWVRQLPPRRS
jgi:hypothetical protein